MNHPAISSLRYAVRPAVVGKRGGQLAVLVAGLTVLPLAVSLWDGEAVAAWRYAAVAGALAGLGGWLARRAAPTSIQTNEALVITALAFVVTPLAMSYPLMASGLGFGDALFESISGITTTGLSTAGAVEGRPLSFHFERVWMQWIGGLGIVVLSVALLAGDDLAAGRLVESPIGPDTLDTSARLHARRCFVIYALLTVAAIAVLRLAGWRGADAVLLALAAVSTGGFAPHDASLAGASAWTARYAVLGIAFLGAVSLPLYHAAWRRRWQAVARDPELRLLAGGCVAGSLLLMLLMARARGGWSPDLAAQAVAMAVSAQTTSGFSTLPPAQLDNASLLAVMAAMAVGGSVGSTAGGIKLLRLLLVLRVAQRVLWRAAMPSRAVAFVRVGGRPVEAGSLDGALFVVVLFGATVGLSWLPFLMAGQDPLRSLFEIVSAVGTVGLSTGVAAPELPAALKAVLCLDMLLGRVEFAALLIALSPRTWWGRRRTS
jgi:trk system potassium uptake protein TrkH